MRTKEVHETLCKLVTEVGTRMSRIPNGRQVTHDCICGENPMSEGIVDDEILMVISRGTEIELAKIERSEQLCQRR